MADQLIETPRLRLTRLSAADLPALERHWNDVEVGRYLFDGEPVPRDLVESLLAASDAGFASRGLGLWAVRRRAERSLAGCAGFHTFHEPPRLELVISLEPGLWGRGLATELGEALIRHAFEAAGHGEVLASCDAPHEASIALASRLGLERQSEAVVRGLPTVFFRRRRNG